VGLLVTYVEALPDASCEPSFLARLRLDSVMSLASPFYDSSAVQALGGILATILTALIAIWVARNVQLPKRCLYYGISETIPLLTPHSSVRGDLELIYKGTALANPHLATLHISLRGRQDIASEDYDSDQPLQIGIGISIVAILMVTSKPETSPVPHITSTNSSLAVGPSLIHSGQMIQISVLIDADNTSISCKNSLKNVKVKRQRPDDPELAVLLMGPHNLFILGTLGSIAALMIAQISKQPLSWIPFIISLPLLLLAFVGAAWSFWTLLKRPIDNKRASIIASRINRRKLRTYRPASTGSASWCYVAECGGEYASA